MIRFKTFMLESRLDFIKSHTPTLSTDHDHLAVHKTPSDIVDHLATHADPSKNHKYTQWVVGQYKKGHIRQEDAGRVHDALQNLEKHGKKIGSPSITSFHHISDLEDKLEPHIGTAGSKREEVRQIKHDGAEKIHDGEKMMVHKLKTKEAACHYGKGTKWCTAADNNNMFDDYNKKGPLYVVSNKETGKKHQFHFETGQFMDEKDKPVKLPALIKKNPELKDVKEFRDSSSHGHNFARNDQEFNHSMNKSLDHEDVAVRHDAIQHPKATAEHISKALNDKDRIVHQVAIQHPNLTTAHIDKAMKDRDHILRGFAIKHPNATTEHISKALDDEDAGVRGAAIQHPKVTSAHIDKALNDKNMAVRSTAIWHPNVTSAHIDKALNDTNELVRQSAIRHPNATSAHIDKALKDSNARVRKAASEHPNATASQKIT